MQTDALLSLITHTLEEHKAIDVKVMDVSQQTTLTDYLVIASGTSLRQVAALADHVVQAAKRASHPPLSLEGAPQSEWVLVDLQDIIVHIMLPETRVFYDLEKLWGMTERLRQQQ